MMKGFSVVLFALSLLLFFQSPEEVNGAVFGKTKHLIEKANRRGPYIGIVIPNLFELDPLLNYPEYKSSKLVIDVSGRRFRFGQIGSKRVILVMTGLGMLNAGVTTDPHCLQCPVPPEETWRSGGCSLIQGGGIGWDFNTSIQLLESPVLLSLFDITGVVHYGIAGNANPDLHIGDVAIPQYWSHSALWSWQRYGNGPENELPLEANGDYTRDIGYLKFSEYETNVEKCNSSDNLLNNIWYQPEEVFPVDGTPEERQHAFWVPTDPFYFNLAKVLECLKLEGCLNTTTCLSYPPKVVTVKSGTSASIYLDNAAYRGFIYNKFEIGPVEMESAAVALVSYQQRVPFIVIRALSDLAGGGEQSNKADTFTALAANNSVRVTVEFIKLLPSPRVIDLV